MNKTASVTCGFLLIALVAYGLYQGALSTQRMLMGLNEEISVAIIAASATFLVSVATVVYNQRKTTMREIDNSHRPQKIEIYKKFMDKAVLKVLRDSSAGKTHTEEFRKEMEDLFFSFTGDIIVWGSPEVIRAYSAFRSSGGSADVLLRVDDLLQAMRKDLGNRNVSLKRGDLIKLFITDPEKLDNVVTQSAA